MAFFFTCGTHTFKSLLKGYENITVQCQNCGNFSAKVTKSWEWFTFCFVPVIPFSLKPWQQVSCHICRFQQDIKYRPDVQQQMDNPNAQSIPMHNGPAQGWNGGGGQPGHSGPPPGPPGQPGQNNMQYK